MLEVVIQTFTLGDHIIIIDIHGVLNKLREHLIDQSLVVSFSIPSK